MTHELMPSFALLPELGPQMNVVGLPRLDSQMLIDRQVRKFQEIESDVHCVDNPHGSANGCEGCRNDDDVGFESGVLEIGNAHAISTSNSTPACSNFT